MEETKPTMKMPELLVFARAFVVGFVGAEIFRVMFHLGSSFAQSLSAFGCGVRVAAILACLILCIVYASKRGAYGAAVRLGRSRRLDLLASIAFGAWANELAAVLLEDAHSVLKHAHPQWAAGVLAFLCVLLLSPLVGLYWPRPKGTIPQLYFMADEEIKTDGEDLLDSKTQAKSFAETVLASGAHSGLVYGVDGPWGVGKTSFINLAERHWKNAGDAVIVCRFEPLRYASEPDLSERLIRDLSAAIQRQVFVPEFRPTASRYSRLLKGKADISFLGFKLSLEPTGETIDDLLEDIDAVLKRIGRRVIIVVDDLDRLDPKTINNVLFATRRTFKLSQATYVLCYDTEILANEKEDGGRAREFLEKFVTVKLSLFVDSERIRNFLIHDWQRAERQLGSIPSDTMLKLSSVLSELAEILGGDQAANYLPLVGDLRKVKRFVNAMLLMQIEKTNLGRTDFNKRDLVNLMLLHLNYPGLFRCIYAEETEGRAGSFSIKRDISNREFTNSPNFADILSKHEGTKSFLLKQLFDVASLQLGSAANIDEAVQRTRACFNQDSFRNLESYLKLIVRFATPEPQETFALYQNAVLRVHRGASITDILNSDEFRLENGENSHDQFWRVFTNKSDTVNSHVAEDAINTLIEYLPRYSSASANDRGLRQRSIYSLLRILDRAGWARIDKHSRPDIANNVVEIAWRIYGEHTYKGKGLIQRLASSERGVLGWNDLMLFRLQCSIDRQGQLYNINSALILYEDGDAATSGSTFELALKGMRRLSQEVFAHFKRTYIEPKRNFIAEVDETSQSAFLGTQRQEGSETDSNPQPSPISQSIAAARTSIIGFVIYQLSNRTPPSGSGPGCGLYDEIGAEDGGSIARLMNQYAFEICFNPQIEESNILHFLDYCLSNLSSNFFSMRDEGGYAPTKIHLPGGLDPNEMGKYWQQYRDLVMQRGLQKIERHVVTSNYIASYKEDLGKVFAVLDELADDSLK